MNKSIYEILAELDEDGVWEFISDCISASNFLVYSEGYDMDNARIVAIENIMTDIKKTKEKINVT